MRRLSYGTIAGDLPYHAALITADSRGLEIQRHDHDFSEWMLIVSGVGRHSIRDTEEALAPGQLWSIDRYDAHSIQAKANSQLSYINIAFPYEVWRGFVGLGQMPPFPTLMRTEESHFQIETAFRELLAAFVSNPSHFRLLEFFAQVCRLLVKGKATRPVLPEWLRTALDAMRAEENLAAGLPRLIRICSVSPEHLSRTMKTLLGRSPTDWINEARVEMAKGLLRTTDEDIATIAYRCGFRYDTYFHQAFKRTTGQTPKQYRQANARGLLMS